MSLSLVLHTLLYYFYILTNLNVEGLEGQDYVSHITIAALHDHVLSHKLHIMV